MSVGNGQYICKAIKQQPQYSNMTTLVYTLATIFATFQVVPNGTDNGVSTYEVWYQGAIIHNTQQQHTLPDVVLNYHTSDVITLMANKVDQTFYSQWGEVVCSSNPLDRVSFFPVEEHEAIQHFNNIVDSL